MFIHELFAPCRPFHLLLLRVAKAHGVTPVDIVVRVGRRRCGTAPRTVSTSPLCAVCYPSPFQPLERHMTPSLCVDRAQYVRDQARRLLQLDVPRLTPRSAAGIYQFRAAGGWSPVPDTPDTMLPVATGNLAELCIDGLFPRAVCLVQVDAANGVIRWARDHFISLRAVEKVQRNRPDPADRASHLSLWKHAQPMRGRARRVLRS